MFQAEEAASAKAWHVQGAARELVHLEHSEWGGLTEEEVREVPGVPDSHLGSGKDFSFYAERNWDPVKALELKRDIIRHMFEREEVGRAVRRLL